MCGGVINNNYIIFILYILNIIIYVYIYYEKKDNQNILKIRNKFWPFNIVRLSGHVMLE